MKHSLLFLALSLSLTLGAQAQEDNGHFDVRFHRGSVQDDPIAYCRTQLPNLCDGSTFEVANDETDQYGIRHLTLQQYVDGIRVDGKSLRVHQRNGRILSMNGVVLTKSLFAAGEAMGVRRAPRRAADVLEQAGIPSGMADQAELVLTTVGDVTRKAYRVNKDLKVYLIDAFSGEVLSCHSVIKHFDKNDYQGATPVTGKGLTYYTGECDIDFSKTTDGSYILYDQARKVYTLNTSFEIVWANMLANPAVQDSIYATSMSDLYKELATYCAYSNVFSNDVPVWTDPTLEAYCDSISLMDYDPDEYKLFGKYAFAAFQTGAGTIVVTDTVLLDQDENVLHLKEPFKYDSFESMLTSVYLIDEETNETSLLLSRYCNPGYNLIACVLTPDDSNYEQSAQDELDNGYILFYNSMKGYQPAIDIQWGIAKALDYYKETFGRNSFDNKGTEVYCMTNPQSSLSDAENASAAPLEDEGAPGFMMFGMGGPDMFPVVDLPVMGHEFTHLVARELGKTYQDTIDNYSCALNESFADIMGFAITRYAKGITTWSLGNTVMRNNQGLRYFDNPELNGDPSCFGDEHFDTESFEEHANAGVQNHMFYLLCTGGEGVNSLGQTYSVTPMDRTEAEAIAFQTLINYTFSGMNYQDAAKAWQDAAAAMFGETSAQLKSVEEAWAAVGLGNENPTGIDEVRQSAVVTPTRRYNLQGQPVGRDYRGLFIEQ